MAKIVAAVGPKSAGKTNWLARWKAEKPEERRLAAEPRELAGFLDAGLDVGLQTLTDHSGAFNMVALMARTRGVELEVMSFA